MANDLPSSKANSFITRLVIRYVDHISRLQLVSRETWLANLAVPIHCASDNKTSKRANLGLPMSVSGWARSIKRISLKRFHSMRQYKCGSRKVCPGRRCGPPSQQSEIGWLLAAGQTLAPKDTSMYLFVSKRRKIYQKESKAGGGSQKCPLIWLDIHLGHSLFMQLTAMILRKTHVIFL